MYYYCCFSSKIHNIKLLLDMILLMLFISESNLAAKTFTLFDVFSELGAEEPASEFPLTSEFEGGAVSDSEGG